MLSDSNQPNQWIQEEVAWVELCKQVGGFGRIFYRKRRQAINRKSGNVADFLRRWGRNYRYMVVLDADSLMTGQALTRLVAMMERNPAVGIIQTAPRIVNGETLFARLQQFANRLYSPLFLAGLNYWQQHDGNYWGHNAIIRVQPFMSYCCLPDLPGREPFGGRILSHDFVEAALMRKGGWQVWLAGDLEGSYEEGPPTLIDSAKRDRRWCQGNMQHSWLLFARGFRPVSRLHLLMGIMGYVASPLWLLFLLLSSINVINTLAARRVRVRCRRPTPPSSGTSSRCRRRSRCSPSPCCCCSCPRRSRVVVALRDAETAAAFGGRARLVVSAVLETIASVARGADPDALQQQVRRVHPAGPGRPLGDPAPRDGRGRHRLARGDPDACRPHGDRPRLGHLGVHPDARVLLVAEPGAGCRWSLSIPLSILLSKAGIGQGGAADRAVPDPRGDAARATSCSACGKNLAECYQHLRPIEPLRDDYGLLQAVLDPVRQRGPRLAPAPAAAERGVARVFPAAAARLLAGGPAELSVREKMALLLDADSMIWLHRELWRTPAGALAGWWRLAMRQYNVLTATPVTALYR